MPFNFYRHLSVNRNQEYLRECSAHLRKVRRKRGILHTFGRWESHGGRRNTDTGRSRSSDDSAHLRKVGRKHGNSAHLRKVGNARRQEKHGHRVLLKPRSPISPRSSQARQSPRTAPACWSTASHGRSSICTPSTPESVWLKCTWTTVPTTSPRAATPPASPTTRRPSASTTSPSGCTNPSRIRFSAAAQADPLATDPSWHATPQAQPTAGLSQQDDSLSRQKHA